MAQERESAVQKYISSHDTEFSEMVVGGVCKYPELVRQPEFREYTFDASLLDYKLLLFKSGVAPSDINNTVNGVKDRIAKRNHKLEFIQFVHDLKPEILSTDPSNSNLLHEGKAVILNSDTSNISVGK